MMWLHFGEKHYSSLWTMTLLALISAFLCSTINGQWIFDETDDKHTLFEGDQCRIRSGEPGICKQIHNCEPYYGGLKNKTIKYSSLVRCSFVDLTEVVCCPDSDTPPSISPTTSRTTAAVILPQDSFCNTQNGEAGVCKAIDACEPYMEGLRKKTIPYKSLVICSFNGATEVICCPQNTKVPTDSGGNFTGWGTLIDSEIRGFSDDSTTARSRSQNTNDPTTSSPFSANERPAQIACREWKSLSSLDALILGGTAVSPGDYPHVGALLISGDDDVICGSSLISERFVLTAAHCLSEKDRVPTMVRFGVVEWSTPDSIYSPVDILIEETILHDNYRSPISYNDIALIKLVTNVVFSAFVRPACLYVDEGDMDQNRELVVLGWGVTNVQTKNRSDTLLMANLTTVPIKECNDSIIAQGVSRSNFKGVHVGQYCAIDRAFRQDACNADSGGPLQLVEQKDSTIVGIVSYGISCGTTAPSVYVRVAFYLDWIEKLVWPS